MERLFAARDRFGVKPLYYHRDANGGLAVASEIKALHAGGVAADPDEETWATYLTHGLHDHCDRTFWKGIRSLPPGSCLVWDDRHTRIVSWYDLAERVGPQYDTRSTKDVCEEYLTLLAESVQLRFRADVPIGVNLSGGLDSSLLLGMIQQLQGPGSDLRVFTFATGDPAYDELPWVEQMLAETQHPWTISLLSHAEVPDLAESVSRTQDEPFGGLPTIAYAKLFRQARAAGVTVLLDGQGMDEAWAGYDYYAGATESCPPSTVSTVQGTRGQIARPNCLLPDFRQLADSGGTVRPGSAFPDSLRHLQYRDTRYTKLPRALRFNDRSSMAASVELREPFLDHRLFELAMRQPPERKRHAETGKWLLREMARQILPAQLRNTPKRPVQTPQREWLRGPLRDWAQQAIGTAVDNYGGVWLNTDAVWQQWNCFQQGEGDNSFFVWQWISLGLACRSADPVGCVSGTT